LGGVKSHPELARPVYILLDYEPDKLGNERPSLTSARPTINIVSDRNFENLTEAR